MTIPITLSNIGSIPQNPTSAETTINSNNASVTTAFDSALSTSGDQMQGNLDMNSNRILNLPLASSNLEPARLVDLETLTGSGTITVNPLPTGGTTGQQLTKNSNSNFDAGWSTATNVVPTGGSTHQALTKNSGTNFDTGWSNVINSVTAGTGLTGGGTSGAVTVSQSYTGFSSQVGNSSLGSPGSTVNTTGVFMGLGNNSVIIPATSGRMKIEYLGTANATGGSAISLTVRFGTGTAPTNGQAVSGTGSQVAGIITFSGSGGSNLSVPFTNGGIVTGLTVGTTYWVDLVVSTSNASNAASVVSLSFNAFEF